MSHPDQFDLFEEPLFPVRAANAAIDLPRFRSKLKRAMADAIRQCPHSREVIALRMAQYLKAPTFTKSMLDAYTAESKDGHEINLSRFKAFVKATGAVWLWDVVVAEDGLTMLQGDEARLAEIAALQQDRKQIEAQLRALRRVPVDLTRRRSK